MTVSPSIPRTHGVLFAAVLLATAWLALATRPSEAAAAPAVAWSKCYARVGPFQCASVRVPLDYAHPDGEGIDIAVTRLPATDPQRRIGSLFLNPGGPGGSGVDFVVGLGDILYTQEVRARFDLVGFDPRGVMRSSGLRCFGTPQEAGLARPPFAFPTTPAEEAQAIEADRTLDHACEARGTRVRDHMSTANAARDLDVLRQAVGDDSLSYAGYSYGSYLGVTYANMFPDRVRAVVVDGVVDPVAWSTGRGDEALSLPFSTRLRAHASAQATLDEFFRLCDAAGPECAFSGGAAARFAALADRAKAAPLKLVFPDGFTLQMRYSDLVGITLGAMYASTIWRPFAQALADIETASSPPAAGAGMQAFLTKYGPSLYPNLAEGNTAVECEDSDNPDSYSAWSIAGAQADQSSYFGRLWTWSSSRCAEWKASDSERYMGPFDKTTANPLLVVGNRFDPSTSYEGAVAVHELMPSSALLTVNGWGHTSLFLSKCADAAIERYLIEVATPPADTTCDQDRNPFAPSTASTSAASRRQRALSYVNGQSPLSRRTPPLTAGPGSRVLPGGTGPAWSDLTGSAVDALGAQTAVDARGRAVFAWTSYDPATDRARVQARTRSARGRLGPIVALSEPALDAFGVRVAVNARGAAVFSWLEYDSASAQIVLKTRSRSARGVLGPVVAASEPGSDAFDDSIAISDAGDTIVTWTMSANATGGLHARARERSAAGALGPVIELADPALESYAPEVAIDGNGVATFAWTQLDRAAGHATVQTRSRSADGAPGPVVELADATRDTAWVHVAVNRDGDAIFDWLAFDAASHAQVQARSRSSEGTLGSVTDLSDPGDDAYDQTAAVDADGNAVATWWIPGPSGARVETRSLTAGGTAGPRAALSDPADDGYQPRVAVDEKGDAIFTWLAFDSAGVRVQARSLSQRGTFGSPTDVTRPAEDAFSAQVAVTGDGDAILGWSALNGAGYQVQGRSRSAAGGLGPLAIISTADRAAFDAQVERTSQRLDRVGAAG
jgi:pimeloyl-ACP methyl ester carboxylesterase